MRDEEFGVDEPINRLTSFTDPPTVIKGSDILRDYLLQPKKRSFAQFVKRRRK